MRRRVTAKQENASMCFVCGLDNVAGLKAAFFNLENNEVMGVFVPREEHQSYPGRLHGGLAATIFDETMGRVINWGNKDDWGVTVDLYTRFRKPVPLDEEIKVVAKIVRQGGRSYEAEGRIILADGSTAVEGSGHYLILPANQITDMDITDKNWGVVPSVDDPSEVDIPE